jgi:hypothetical protein
MSRDEILYPGAENSSPSSCSNIQNHYGNPINLLALYTLDTRRPVLTSPGTRLHELDVVVFVVCASLCDHVFDALFFQRSLFCTVSVTTQERSSCWKLYCKTSLVLFEQWFALVLFSNATYEFWILRQSRRSRG